MDKLIPMIINGQIEKQFENTEKNMKIDFNNGALVYLPSISLLHIKKIIEYENINTLKLHDIINFLYTVGQRWKNEEYSRRRTYIRELKKFMGYSEQMAKLEANWIAMILSSKSALYDAVDNELGSRHITDEWIPQDECYVRAFPKGKSMHLLAGNVPLSGISSIIRAILTKNQCIIKTSAADPFTAHALAMSFIDTDPEHPITRSLSVVYWSHDDDTSLPEQLIKGMDVVLAWGGSAAIEWAVKHSPPIIDVIKFGPKKSLSLIDNPENISAAATGVAHDICFYDQQACFSSQNVFYIGNSYQAFKSELKNSLNLYKKILPKSKQNFDEQAVYSLTVKECQFAGLNVDIDAEHEWMIIESDPGVEFNQPLGRCVYLHHAVNFDKVLKFIVKYQTQTVSIYPWESSFKYRDYLALKGAERIVESGMNNIFRIGGSHDTMRPLQRLVRFISQERPFDFTAKDVAVKIEQTRFLEEDKFLVFVP
ncbi:long-chain-fatty-acyl-CoA reductase LuxC [Candidatus Enterovibrio altilux]|uniref:Acyl-CoA reductase n=2 Tax=Candidatus Enterovibrio altilux TaxID=1927128 RepID=A0A291BBB3_9GAMM|nr:acyl-CoA reductase [Candidatus Enterovibrio luxaltus]ATF10300.1 LuxC, acyl-CoA reductase [Candidatus Enterovibrio luxaltus]